MPQNPRKTGKMMGFDTRGSVQTMPPFTCSKRETSQWGVFFFWKIKCLLTRVEGGENRGSDLFALYSSATSKYDGKPND